MLVLWLLELMLRKLGSLKDAGVRSESSEYQSTWNTLQGFTEQTRIMVRFQLLCHFPVRSCTMGFFLRISLLFQECIQSNLGAVYSLLASHGLHEVLLHFASKLKDHQRIMEQHLLDRNYKAGRIMFSNPHKSAGRLTVLWLTSILNFCSFCIIIDSFGSSAARIRPAIVIQFMPGLIAATAKGDGWCIDLQGE